MQAHMKIKLFYKAFVMKTYPWQYKSVLYCLSVNGASVTFKCFGLTCNDEQIQRLFLPSYNRPIHLYLISKSVFLSDLSAQFKMNCVWSVSPADIQAALYELCWQVVQGNLKLDLATCVLGEMMVPMLFVSVLKQCQTHRIIYAVIWRHSFSSMFISCFYSILIIPCMRIIYFFRNSEMTCHQF